MIDRRRALIGGSVNCVPILPDDVTRYPMIFNGRYAVKNKSVNNYGYYNPNTGEYVSVYDLIGVEIKSVDYLENTGTEYITTNFIPNSDTRVVALASYTGYKSTAKLFGSRYTLSREAFGTGPGGADTIRFCFNYGYSGNIFSDIPFDYEPHIFDINKNIFYIDNALAGVAPVDSFTTPGKMEIFATLATGTVSHANYIANAKIWYVKIFDNNEIICHFIPVKIGSTGYMLDTVEWKLYANEGTGSFICGAEKPWRWN